MGLVSGLACTLLGEESFSYGIKYHAFTDIYDVELRMGDAKVGPSPNVYGSRYGMGSSKSIGLVTVPLDEVAKLKWEDEKGNMHGESIKIKNLLPDEWKSNRDTIIFTFRSDNKVGVSFLIKEGSPANWYELPPKGETRGETRGQSSSY